MWIPGIGSAGGQGHASTALAPSKSKGKVVQTVHSDDTVSSDDDIPLQRRLKASNNGGFIASRPLAMGHQAPVAATMLPLNPSVVMSPATTLGKTGGDSTVADSVMVESATAEKEVVVDETMVKGATDDATAVEARMVADDAVAAKNVTDDTTTAKKVTDNAEVVKKATDDVVATKVTDDTAVVKSTMDDAAAVTKKAATDKMAVDAAVREKATSDATVTEGSTAEVASQDVVEISLTSVAGAKRATASGGSTPPAKRRFRGSWKPRYASEPCICLLFSFCFT
jgi:hypothetical protein